MEEIFGFVNNMAFPKNLYQFEKNMENDEYFNVLDVLSHSLVGWTVDKYAKLGQLCFWSHTATTITNITNIEEELKGKTNHPKYSYLMNCLEKAKQLYNKYGGKIFAVGRVVGEPFEEKHEDRDYIHWSSRVYGVMYNFYNLTTPIDRQEFSDFITIANKGAITNLNKEQCEKLLKMIEEKEGVKIPLVDEGMVNRHFYDTSNQ